jgi:polysaccharide export outer membrane protein
MPSRSLLRPLAVVVTLLAVACVRPQQLASPTTEAPALPNLPFDSHAATRFGPSDDFEVRLIGDADLSGAYRVAPDGTFDFPYCGRLNVEGLIASEVATKLQKCLKEGKFYTDPQVVVVGKNIGAGRKIFVYGNVQKAGPFPYDDNMSIVEAIALAGGFAAFAGQNQISVIRPTSDGKDQKFKVAVQDIGLGKAPNFQLRPGDIVYVPESAF